MKILRLAVFALFMAAAVTGRAQEKFESDILKTSSGDLRITFIGHGTLMFTFEGKVIHVDPWSNLADYSQLPQADLVLITHDHRDHLDVKVLGLIRSDRTMVVIPPMIAKQVEGAIVMGNGETKIVDGLPIEAVPAYNLVSKRDSGEPYHPKGNGNGYVITFADKRVYVAGDTENTPEMKSLKNIDIAFLPMNLPATMSPEMVADAAIAVRPKILYPYHFGETDVSKLTALLKDYKEIEIRIRKMK